MTEPADVLDPKKAATFIPLKANERPHVVFDGLTAADPRWMGLVVALREQLTRLPVDQLSEGAYSGLGITDEFDKLGMIPGIGMQPGGIAPYDAYAQYGDEKVPASCWVVLDLLLDVMMPTRLIGRSISVNKYSSIGAPSLAKDALRKTREALGWSETVEARLALMRTGSLEELYKSHQQVFVYTGGERHQLAKIRYIDGKYTVKDREVYTYEREWQNVSWSAPEPWASFSPLFHRDRRRVINVVSTASWPLRTLHANIFPAMKHAAPNALDHRSNRSIAAKLSRYPAVRFFDAKNHDWHIHPGFIVRFLQAIGKRYGWAWAVHALMVLRQAQLVKPDRLGQGGARLEGDPFDLRSFRARYGNPSGIPLTSVIAYLAGTWYALCMLVLAGHLAPTRAAIGAILAGTNREWTFLNAGDNIAFGGPSDEAISRLPSLIGFAEIGEADSFLGAVPLRSNGQLTFVPNITSYVNNLLMPGRSLSDPQRGNPILGAAARRKIFEEAPAYEKVHSILNPLMKEYTGIDYGALVAAGQAEANAMDYVEALIHYNKDVIHYRVDPKDVPRDLLEQYYVLIPATQADALIDGYRRADHPEWEHRFTELTSDYPRS